MQRIALLAILATDAESLPFTVEAGTSANLLFRAGPGCPADAAITIEARGSEAVDEDPEDPNTWTWEPFASITNRIGDKLKGLALEGQYRLNRANGVNAGVDYINAPE